MLCPPVPTRSALCAGGGHPHNDADGDVVDLCPGDASNADSDSDGVCDGVDCCPVGRLDDLDGDGISDGVDSCGGDASPNLCGIVAGFIVMAAHLVLGAARWASRQRVATSVSEEHSPSHQS